MKEENLGDNFHDICCENNFKHAAPQTQPAKAKLDKHV